MNVRKGLLFLIVMLIVASSLTFAGCCDRCHGQTTDLNRKIDGKGRVMNAGKVFALPDGTNKIFCTVVVSPDFRQHKREADLLAWFSNDPRLLQLRADTNFNSYDTSNEHYKQALAPKYGVDVPKVILQRADGENLMHIGPNALPLSVTGLADLIYDGLDRKLAPPSFADQETGTPVIASTDPADCPGPDCKPNPPPSETVQPIPEYEKPILPRGNTLVIVAIAGAVVLVVVATKSGAKKKSGMF